MSKKILPRRNKTGRNMIATQYTMHILLSFTHIFALWSIWPHVCIFALRFVFPVNIWTGRRREVGPCLACSGRHTGRGLLLGQCGCHRLHVCTVGTSRIFAAPATGWIYLHNMVFGVDLHCVYSVRYCVCA
jgi:hypothetical protein